MTNRIMVAVLMACTMLAPIASSAQQPNRRVRTPSSPDPYHRAKSLSSATHSVAHSGYMGQMLARMDTTVLRVRALSTRIADRLGDDGEPSAKVRPELDAMNQRLMAMTEQLDGLANQMRSMMRDTSMLRDRRLQRDMEDVQVQLGAIATAVERTAMAVEKMAGRSGDATTRPIVPD